MEFTTEVRREGCRALACSARRHQTSPGNPGTGEEVNTVTHQSTERDSAALMAEIGPRLRQLRLANALSQKTVGKEIGVSFQQVQKYENGTDAVPLHRLLK